MSGIDIVVLDLFGDHHVGLVSEDGKDIVDKSYCNNISRVEETANYNVEELFEECKDLDKEIPHKNLHLCDAEFMDILTEYGGFVKLFINYLLPNLEVVSGIFRQEITENCIIYQFNAINKKTDEKTTLDLVISSVKQISFKEFGQILETLQHAHRPANSNPNRILLSILPLSNTFCNGSYIAKSNYLSQYRSNIVLNLNGLAGEEKYRAFIEYYKTGIISSDDPKLTALDSFVKYIESSDCRILDIME